MSLFDYVKSKKFILLGVGWKDYQLYPNFYTKFILRYALDKKLVHSVRGSYTLNLLHRIGIYNVINTGCPTMWRLNREHCSAIPQKKSRNVIFTLTDYNRDLVYDKELIIALKNNYDNLYFWIQGSEDLNYLKYFGSEFISSINIIPPKLKSYDLFLAENKELDYVGTRLHAGIRALQKKHRSVIIGIDSRALEMQKDFNIPVVNRVAGIDILIKKINSKFRTDINIDETKINNWKNQF